MKPLRSGLGGCGQIAPNSVASRAPFQRAGFAGGFEGQQSILANYDNGRIHYRKGVWILYSGNYVMGDSALLASCFFNSSRQTIAA